jgi:hypothetical protein
MPKSQAHGRRYNLHSEDRQPVESASAFIGRRVRAACLLCLPVLVVLAFASTAHAAVYELIDPAKVTEPSSRSQIAADRSSLTQRDEFHSLEGQSSSAVQDNGATDLSPGLSDELQRQLEEALRKCLLAALVQAAHAAYAGTDVASAFVNESGPCLFKELSSWHPTTYAIETANQYLEAVANLQSSDPSPPTAPAAAANTGTPPPPTPAPSAPSESSVPWWGYVGGAAFLLAALSAVSRRRTR